MWDTGQGFGVWGFALFCFFVYFLATDTQLLLHSLLKRLSFLHWTAFAPLSKVNWPYTVYPAPLICVPLHTNTTQSWLLQLCNSWNRVIIPTLFFLQNCFGYHSSYTFPYKFFNNLTYINTHKNFPENLIGIALKLYINYDYKGYRIFNSSFYVFTVSMQK